MDPLSIVASTWQAQDIYLRARAERTRRETSLLTKNYGRKTAFVISLLSPQTIRQYEIIDTMVLNGGDEGIRVFRQTITDESNMTAVAVRWNPGVKRTLCQDIMMNIT